MSHTNEGTFGVSPVFDWRTAVTLSDLEPTTRHVALTLSLYMNAKTECRPSQTTLAKDTGLSRSTVNEHLQKLHKAGFVMMAHRRRSTDGRQSSNVYRATIPTSIAEVMTAETSDGIEIVWLDPRVPEADTDSRDWGTRTRAIGGHQESVEEGGEESGASPTPPQAEGESSEGGQQQLDGTTAPETRAARKKRLEHKAGPAFDGWWPDFPGNSATKGSRANALRAYVRRLEAGSSTEEIESHRENYSAARKLWEAKTGQPAPLMHGSSFLNGKFDLWSEPWGEDEVRDYWPIPDGVTWGKGKRLTRAELEARMAEGLEG